VTTTLSTDDDQDHAIATRVATPFGRQANTAAVAVEGQRAIAEVQAALFIASKNPRNEIAALDRILNMCARESLAAVARYSYARGGKTITGPSIRLAEAIAQRWGNFSFGTRELEQRHGESTVETFAWDIETNTRAVKEFTVPHVRKSGDRLVRLTDPRDIYELVANNGARRLRACILAVIPRDITDAAVDQCAATLKAKIKIDDALIESLLTKFDAYGVKRKALEANIQRRLESITPALVIRLGDIYNSLEDGMSSPADWFEIEPAAPTGGTKADAVRATLAAKGKPAAATAGAAQPTTAPPEPATASQTQPESKIDGGAVP
jgi:hypothetical protein